MSDLREKRRHPRIEVSIPLRYKELRGNVPLARGTLTKNLSAGGVRFRTENFVGLACRLLVEMNLPTIQKPIRAISKVAWIKKLPTGDNYEIGNQFLNITREDKALIADYANKALGTSGSA